MPFYKFDSFFHLDHVDTSFDYTIIGAGAAGICLAINLTRAGKKVLLIESGLMEDSKPHQKLNEVLNTGKEMDGISTGRKRAFGGTTIAWGGQSLPFSEIDFAKKDWLKNSGWPISYAEIFPYYKEANLFMGIHDNQYYGPEALKKIKLKNPGFNPSLLNYHVSKWAKKPNFKKLYSNELDKNIFVLYNASLNKINTDRSKVTSIELINLDLNHYTIPVKQLIIATGGIESNRLLLRHPQLFKDKSKCDLIGKGFMDHPCLDIGYVIPKNDFYLQKYFNTHIFKGYRESIRLSLSEIEQRKKQLLNGSASLFFESDGSDLFTQLKTLRKELKFRTVSAFFSGSGGFMKTLQAYLFNSFIFKNKAKPIISLMIEQESISSSYLTLSDELDGLQQEKIIVNWDISSLTWKTILSLSALLKSEMERLDFGKVVCFGRINPNNADWKMLLSDVNHHMGGLKMSNDPETGIVDQDLKVWGIDNLYIASTATFPTSSHSNPTLTLLALCQRLVHHLLYKPLID